MKDISKLSYDLSKWVDKLPKEIIKANEDTALAVYQDIMKLAPENTGTYKDSITFSDTEYSEHKVKTFIGSDMQVVSSEGKKYNLGYLLENGTNAHIIKPVKAKSLHFIIDGKDVFTKLVHHPGSREIPHYSIALENNKQRYLKNLSKAIMEARK